MYPICLAAPEKQMKKTTSTGRLHASSSVFKPKQQPIQHGLLQIRYEKRRNKPRKQFSRRWEKSSIVFGTLLHRHCTVL